MAAELEAEGVTVRIYGVNEAGLESGNAQASEGRDLPWLQDTPEENVWGRWKVDFRDVVVLDAENVPRSVYNLTENPLGQDGHDEELAEILRDLAP